MGRPLRSKSPTEALTDRSHEAIGSRFEPQAVTMSFCPIGSMDVRTGPGSEESNPKHVSWVLMGVQKGAKVWTSSDLDLINSWCPPHGPVV